MRRFISFHLKFKSLSKCRHVEEVRVAKEQYIADDKGEKVAVIVPLKEYEELLEDLHDLAVVAERRDEPASSFEEVKERLRKNGLL